MKKVQLTFEDYQFQNIQPPHKIHFKMTFHVNTSTAIKENELEQETLNSLSMNPFY